jgi:hypothetical protein
MASAWCGPAQRSVSAAWRWRRPPEARQFIRVAAPQADASRGMTSAATHSATRVGTPLNKRRDQSGPAIYRYDCDRLYHAAIPRRGEQVTPLRCPHSACSKSHLLFSLRGDSVLFDWFYGLDLLVLCPVTIVHRRGRRTGQPDWPASAFGGNRTHDVGTLRRSARPARLLIGSASRADCATNAPATVLEIANRLAAPPTLR